jgi:hypothetical protein
LPAAAADYPKFKGAIWTRINEKSPKITTGKKYGSVCRAADPKKRKGKRERRGFVTAITVAGAKVKC